MLDNNIQYFKEEEALPYMKQIMNGFQILRKNNIYHRDVKLANILKDGDNIKIGDFGAAREGLGTKKSFCGTLLTMAPELIA